jgi:hypothetical protein
MLLIFLKGMTGALAPFSYLVVKSYNVSVDKKKIVNNNPDLIMSTSLYYHFLPLTFIFTLCKNSSNSYFAMKFL